MSVSRRGFMKFLGIGAGAAATAVAAPRLLEASEPGWKPTLRKGYTEYLATPAEVNDRTRELAELVVRNNKLLNHLHSQGVVRQSYAGFDIEIREYDL